MSFSLLKNSNKLHFFVLLSTVLFVSLAVTSPVFAVVYQPGETLDPDCAPSDLGCGVSISTSVDLGSSQATGVLPINHGGTGLSTTPGLGQVLIGNNSGGFDISAATSLKTHLNINLLDDTAGTLSVVRGGTGATSFDAGAVLVGNGTGAIGTAARADLLAGTGLALSGSGTDALLGSNLTVSLDIDALAEKTAANFTTDFIPIYDSSIPGIRKISRGNFLQGLTGAMTYLGTWDAGTNTPTLSNATGGNGNVYAVSAAGTVDLGSGNIAFVPGDFIIHNGTVWQRAPSGSAVTSVFARTGAITAQNGDYTGGQITFTPGGTLSSTNVQAAIEELLTESAASFFAQNGNSFGAAATLGTNDNFALNLETNGTTKLTVLANGNVGLGVTNPTDRLVVGPASGANDILINDSNTAEWKIGTGSFGLSFKNDFDDNGTYDTRMFINSGGNVGINTTTPAEKLTVVSGDNAATTNILHVLANNGTQGIAIGYDEIRKTGSNANSQLKINARGTGHLILQDTATGNVGIGTTNPDDKLTVVTSGGGFYGETAVIRRTAADAVAALLVSNTGTSGAASVASAAAIVLDAKAGGSAHGRTAWIGAEGVLTNDRATRLVFKVRPSGSDQFQWSTMPTAMIIDHTGNVGIGTTNPDSKLGVMGGLSLGSNTANDNILRLNHDRDTFAGIYGQMQHTGNTGGLVITAQTDLLANAGSGAITFRTSDSATAAAERMKITGSGNVGIGTTTPLGPLHTRFSGTATPAIFESTGGGAGETTVLDLQGPTTGNTAVSINFGLQAAGDLTTSAAGNYRSLAKITMLQTINAGGSLQFKTKNDEADAFSTRMHIDRGGNVGINTVTPASQLHVFGAQATVQLGNDTTGSALKFFGSHASGAYIQAGNSPTDTGAILSIARRDTETTNISRLNVRADTSYFSGNVGIATTNPAFPLEVTGRIKSSTGYIMGSDLGLFPIAANQSVMQTYWATQISGLTETVPGSYTPASVGIGNNAYHVVMPMVNTSAAGLAILGVGSQTGNYFEIASNANKGTTHGDILTVNASGNLGIGTTTPGARIHALATSGDIAKFEGASNTNCVFSPGVTMFCTSDKTLKNVEGAMDGSESLAAVLALKPTAFSWKSDKDGKTQYGFIAQEVEEVLPGLVVTDGTTNLKGVSMLGMVPYIVNAVQELSRKIDGFFMVLENGWRRLSADELCLVDNSKTPSELVCVDAKKLREISNGSISTPAGSQNETENEPESENQNDEDSLDIASQDTQDDEGESESSPPDEPGASDGQTNEDVEALAESDDDGKNNDTGSSEDTGAPHAEQPEATDPEEPVEPEPEPALEEDMAAG